MAAITVDEAEERLNSHLSTDHYMVNNFWRPIREPDRRDNICTINYYVESVTAILILPREEIK